MGFVQVVNPGCMHSLSKSPVILVLILPTSNKW